MQGAWQRLVAQASRSRAPFAVVTHGLVCHAIVTRCLDDPVPLATMHFANASLTVIDGPSPWHARLVDCTRHLLDEVVGSGPV